MRRSLSLCTLVVAVTALAHTASPVHADRKPLGSYERQALATALNRRGLELDPAPEGKRLRRVHVVNLDVFSKRDGFLQWFNFFHRTSREGVVAREVLLEPGDLWDDDIVEETKRRLSDELFTTLVVVVAVKSPVEGTVDLLVVTRDIWSLRLNSGWEIQNRKLTALTVSISENNFLGYRKQLALVFDMDQGTYALGPQYVDKNIRGTRLVLQTKWSAIFARDGDELEGSRSITALSYPLWSLRRHWGASISASHFDGIARVFQGTELLRCGFPTIGDDFVCDNTELPDDVETVPFSYQRRVINLDTLVTRSLPGDVIHRISFGHELSIDRSELLEGFAASPELQAAFEDQVLPRSERSSAFVLRHTWFANDFRVYRGIDSYDLPEDRRLGGEAVTSVAVARKEIGSEANFVRLGINAAWTWDVYGDGFVRINATAAGRREAGRSIDNVFSVGTKLAGPRTGDIGRFVVEAVAATRTNDERRSFFTLGGSTGLRGFPIGAFRGDKLVRANLEFRTRGSKLWFTRYGFVAFWDLGHVADDIDDLAIQQDVGAGLRVLLPQLQPYVFRFDWAVPLTGRGSGLPGRFIAGVRQAF